MGSYSLNVNIEDDDVYCTLVDGGYNLCIAKMVNNAFTVVWSGKTFLQYTNFEWTEEYQVFGTETFKHGMEVKASTKSKDIMFGQKCVMDARGMLHHASGTADTSGTFEFDNCYGTVHAGVSCKIQDSFKPIFVSKKIVKGVDELSPVVKLMVWFDCNNHTGTMFEYVKSRVVEIDFTAPNPSTELITYTADETWTVGDSYASSIVPPQFYNCHKGFIGQDIGLDPHQFTDIVRRKISQTTPPKFTLEIDLTFSTIQEATFAWIYFKYKIIPNLVQKLEPSNDSLSFKLKLGWEKVTYMKHMMVGKNDSSKLRNAFVLELNGLAHQPSDFSIADITS